MHSERYVHPEFGFLSPTPRLRRDLRTAFLSLLFGIGLGSAAVIALSGNNNGDDTRGPHGRSSASVISEEPVLGDNSPQPAGIEKSLNKDHTSKPNGSTADANSENRKTNATCEGDNSGCRKVPPAGKRGGTQMPATVGTTSAAPSTSSEPAPEHSTAGRSEEAAVDRLNSNRLTHNKPHKTARSQNQPRQVAPNSREGRAAFWTGRGYERPVGESRAYALDRFVLGVEIDAGLPAAYAATFAILMAIQWSVRRRIADIYLENQRQNNRVIAHGYTAWDNIFSGNRYNWRLWLGGFKSKLRDCFRAQVNAIMAREGLSALGGIIGLAIVFSTMTYVVIANAGDTEAATCRARLR
jgi:hypothetical protein